MIQLCLKQADKILTGRETIARRGRADKILTGRETIARHGGCTGASDRTRRETASATCVAWGTAPKHLGKNDIQGSDSKPHKVTNVSQ